MPSIRFIYTLVVFLCCSLSVFGSSIESSNQLNQLLHDWKSGGAFTQEEIKILRAYEGVGRVTKAEADVLISRALYDSQRGVELTKDQEKALDHYREILSNRNIDILDWKLMNVEKAWLESADFPRVPQAPPPNDQCSGAEVIPGSGPFPYLTAVTPDITDATTVGDPPTPSCQPNYSRSIWYTFTPTTTATYTILTCADGPTGTTVDDTIIAIYTSANSCNGPFTEIPSGGGSDGCDDDTCTTEALQSILSTHLTAGTTYYILVDQFDTPPPTAGNTAVQLRINQVLPPANDNCSGTVPALSLNTPLAATFDTSVINDFQLPPASACYAGIGQVASIAPGRDLVYSFTPPFDGNFSFKVNSSNGMNPVLYVADNCAAGPPPATISGCQGASNRNSATAPASEEVMCLPLTGGNTYTVYLDENALTTTITNVVLEVNECIRETESNDTPGTANAITCGIEGTVSPAGSADFFDLGSPSIGSRVFAMVEGLGGNSNDFDMRVTTFTDTLEYDDLNNDTLFGSLAPNVSGTPLTGDQSFIRMSHFSLATQAEPYRLYSVIQPDLVNAIPESEPNDTSSSANADTTNYFSGVVGLGDSDFFGTSAVAGDLLVVQLDSDPLRNNTPFNGILALFDENGNTLVTVNDSGATSNPTPSPNTLTGTTPNSPAEALLWRVRTTGNYFVRVSTAAAANDYLLSIAKNCSTGGGGLNTDLAVTNDDFPDPIVPNNDLTYTIVVDNIGGPTALNVSLDDPLDPQTTFVSLSSPGGWSCTTPAVGQNGTVSCTNPAVSSTYSFTLVVHVNAGLPDGTVITNTATVTSSNPDTDPSNDQAIATTTTQCSAISVTPATVPDGIVGAIYNQQLDATGGIAPYTFAVDSGSLPPNMILDSSTGNIGGLLVQSGSFGFTISATDANGCVGLQGYVMQVDCPAMSLSPNTLPDGFAGQFYQQLLTVNGGTIPYTFSVTVGSLPGGLTLDPNSGQISGTPTGSGSFDFTVTVTDTYGCSASQAYTLLIQCPVITIDPPVLPDGTIGVVYNQTLTATGGNAPYIYAVTAGALPTGLTLDSNTGVISGTPLITGTVNFTVTATDSTNCTGSLAYNLTINCAAITITPSTLPDGVIGTGYDQTLTASGGLAPYAYSVSNGTLPDGLSLDPNSGQISGTPTTAGLSNFDVTATDSAGCTGTQSYSINIAAACMFCDEFDDSTVDPNWTYIKNSSFWSEDGTSLLGTNSRKTTAIASPVFVGCLNCYAQTTMRTAGGPGNRLWLIHHYVDKQNMVELLMKQETGRWVIKHRVNGKVAAKQKYIMTILPNTDYVARVTYDGVSYTVTIDGTPLTPSLTPGGVVTQGTIALRVKGTTGTFDRVEVN